jgi:hypothetical protein
MELSCLERRWDVTWQTKSFRQAGVRLRIVENDLRRATPRLRGELSVPSAVPATLGSSGPRRGARTTSQGHPRTVFRRALERGNLLVAEATARDVGHIDLREALELTALTALHDRERGGRLALRWLQRWLEESGCRAMDEAAMVASALAALGGAGHHDALLSLRAVAMRRASNNDLSASWPLRGAGRQAPIKRGRR